MNSGDGDDVIDEVLAEEEPNLDKEQFEEMKFLLSELAGSRRYKDDTTGDTEEGRRALKVVYNYLHKSGAEAQAEFRKYDTDGSGSLEPTELARMLHSALPQLTPAQLRYVLGHLQRHDLDGDGCLSYAELRVAMRAVDIKWRKRRVDGPMGDEGPEEEEEEAGADHGQWELQEFSYHGHPLLLDPRTQRVFFLPPPDPEEGAQGGGGEGADEEAWWGGNWPILVGKMESDGTVAVAAPLPPDALWAALDAYLKDNKMQLQQLYEGYDADGNGCLDPAELGQLLGQLLGPAGFRPAQLKYAAAMMDANCDGSVSYGEFLAAARDSLKAAAALKAELARRPPPPPLPQPPPPPPAPQRSAPRLSSAPSAASVRSAASGSGSQPPAPAAEPSGAVSVRSVRSVRSAVPSASASARQPSQQPSRQPSQLPSRQPSQQPSHRSVAYDEAEDAPAAPASPPPPSPPPEPAVEGSGRLSAQASQPPPEEEMEAEEEAPLEEEEQGLEGPEEGSPSRRPLSPGRRWNRRQAAAATARWLASRAPLPEHSPGTLPSLAQQAEGIATLRAKLHTGHRFPVSSVAFSPSGGLLATASRDVRLYDVRSGRLRAVLDGHGGLVRCLAFSPDGRQLCSGADDAAVLVWNLEACLALSRPGQVATLTPPGFPSSTNPSAGAPVAPSGVPLTSTGTAGATAAGTPRSNAGGSTGRPGSAGGGSHGHGGGGSSTGGGGGSFHPMQRVVSKALRRHHKPVLAMAATADSKYLVTGGADRTVRVWDTGSGYCLATLRGHHGDVTSVAVSSSGKHIYSGGSDRVVFVWDFNTGECVRQLKGHKGAVSTISLAPDGQWLVTGGHDKALRVWDAANGTELAVLPAHGGAFGVVASALSPCGAVIASGGYDHLVKLWDANSGLAVATLEGHRHMVSSVAFSPDGTLLATAGRDDEVRLWDFDPTCPHLSASAGAGGARSSRPRTAGGASSRAGRAGGGGGGMYTTTSVTGAGGAGGSPQGAGTGRLADAPVPRPAEQAFNRHWECLFGARGQAAGKTATEAAAFAMATERGRARAASAGRVRPGTAPAGGRRW